MADTNRQFQTVLPTGPQGDPFQHIGVNVRGPDTTPIGEGLQRLGTAGLETARFFGMVAADDAATQYQERVDEIMHGKPGAVGPDGKPDLGFMGLKGRAALDAKPDTDRRMEELRKEVLGGLKTFDQQRVFNQASRRYKSYAEGRMGQHADAQANVWYDQVDQAAAGNWQKHIANNALDPKQVIEGREQLRRVYVQKAERAGGGPELITAAVNRADREAVIAQASAISVTDPAKAMRIVENNKDALGTSYDELAARFRARGEQQQGREYADDLLSGNTPNENNIGNVRPRGSSTGFVQVKSFDEGVGLAVNNVRAYPAAFNGGKDMTLQQIGAKWAPKGDGANDPNQWAKNVAAGSGLPTDKPIDLNDPETAAKFARGVHLAEWGAKKVRPLEDYKKAVAGGAAPTPEQQPRSQADLIAEVQAKNLEPQAEAAAIARINQSFRLRDAAETKNRAEFKQREDDSVAEALNTGTTSTPIAKQDFVRHYGPADGEAKFANYESNIVYAADRNSLDTMSDVEQQQFLASRTPQPGARGYAYAMNRQAQLEKDAAQIQKNRSEDPAGAVVKNPAVQAAMGRYDPKDPASFKGVADARLAAQERLGIPPEFRSPITKSEALKLTAPLRTMLPGDESKVLQEMGTKFKQMFGDQADEAFAYAIRAHKVDAEVAQQAASVVRKLRDGIPLVPAEVAPVDDAKERAAADRAVKGFPPAIVPGRAPLRSIDNPDEAPEAAGPPVPKPMNVPPAAIEFLLKNPGTDAAFDKKYGTGRAKTIREKFPAAPGLP